MIWTDLQTAFDNANHNVLTEKMEFKFGLNGLTFIYQIRNLKFIIRTISHSLETSYAEFLKDQFQRHYFFFYILMICHKLLTVNCWLLTA